MDSTVAIITLGGKQHLVSQGARVVVSHLALQEGEIIKQNDLLSNRVVQAKVLSHQLGKKINGLKFKAKTRYLKRYGHRQSETTVVITSIGDVAPKTDPKKATPSTKKLTSVRKTSVPAKKASAVGKNVVDDKA